jgi:hypothetical protein
MAKNYDAWKISVHDFEKQKNNFEKLAFFIKFGLLAPSSHNSQPWEFEINEKDLLIKIFKAKERVLPIGDPNDDLCYVSIGCVTENIIISADYFGFSSEIIYEENIQGDLCLTLKFTKDHEVTCDSEHLVHQISKRIVNRGKYENKPLPENFLEEIKEFSDENHEIVFVDDRKKIFSIGEIANYASIKLMDSHIFRKELSDHVKNNFTKSYVGIPAFGMGINNLLSLFVPTLVKIFNMDKASKNQNLALFKKHTPLLVVIASKNDSKKAKIISGRLYQKISLYAMAENIKTSPWGAITVHKESREKLKNFLNTGFHPDFLFRMGYNEKDPKHSPRLLIDAVLKK